jgi:hypothetical protein
MLEHEFEMASSCGLHDKRSAQNVVKSHLFDDCPFDEVLEEQYQNPFNEAPKEGHDLPFDEAPEEESGVLSVKSQKGIKCTDENTLAPSSQATLPSSKHLDDILRNISVLEESNACSTSSKFRTGHRHDHLQTKNGKSRKRNPRVENQEDKPLEDYLPAIELFLKNQQKREKPSRHQVSKTRPVPTPATARKKMMIDPAQHNSSAGRSCDQSAVDDNDSSCSSGYSCTDENKTSVTVASTSSCCSAADPESVYRPQSTFTKCEECLDDEFEISWGGCTEFPWLNTWGNSESLGNFGLESFKSVFEPDSWSQYMPTRRDESSASSLPVEKYCNPCEIFEGLSLDDKDSTLRLACAPDSVEVQLQQRDNPGEKQNVNIEYTQIRTEARNPAPSRLGDFQDGLSTVNTSIKTFFRYFERRRQGGSDSTTASSTESESDDEESESEVRGLDFVSVYDIEE